MLIKLLALTIVLLIAQVQISCMSLHGKSKLNGITNHCVHIEKKTSLNESRAILSTQSPSSVKPNRTHVEPKHKNGCAKHVKASFRKHEPNKTHVDQTKRNKSPDSIKLNKTHNPRTIHHNRTKHRKLIAQYWIRSKPWMKLTKNIEKLKHLSHKRNHTRRTMIKHSSHKQFLQPNNHTREKTKVKVDLMKPLPRNTTTLRMPSDSLHIKKGDSLEELNNDMDNNDGEVYEDFAEVNTEILPPEASNYDHVTWAMSKHELGYKHEMPYPDLYKINKPVEYETYDGIGEVHRTSNKMQEKLKQKEIEQLDTNKTKSTAKVQNELGHSPLDHILTKTGHRLLDQILQSDHLNTKTNHSILENLGTKTNHSLDSLPTKEIFTKPARKAVNTKDLNLLRLNLSDIVRIETKISVKKNLANKSRNGIAIPSPTQKYVITNVKVEKADVIEHLDDMVKQSMNKVMLMDKSILDEYLAKKAVEPVSTEPETTTPCYTKKLNSYIKKTWRSLIYLIMLILLLALCCMYICVWRKLQGKPCQPNAEKLVHWKNAETRTSSTVMYKTFDHSLGDQHRGSNKDKCPSQPQPKCKGRQDESPTPQYKKVEVSSTECARSVSPRTRQLFNEFKKYEGSLFRDFSDAFNYRRVKFQDMCKQRAAAVAAVCKPDDEKQALLNKMDKEEECNEKMLDMYNYTQSNCTRPKSSVRFKIPKAKSKKDKIQIRSCEKKSKKKQKKKLKKNSGRSMVEPEACDNTDSSHAEYEHMHGR